MIGIITAMPAEAAFLRDRLVMEQRETVGGIDFMIGDIKNSFVCLGVGGIGKVNAAMCAQIMIDRYNVGVVFNAGVAGGRRGSVKRGGLVVADGLVQHDVDTTALGDPRGMVSTIHVTRFEVNETISGRVAERAEAMGVKAVRGVVASGDQFIHSAEQVEELYTTFKAVAFEMEAGAVAQVCLRNGIEFVSVKCISDYADGNGGRDYKMSLEECALLPQKVIYETLK